MVMIQHAITQHSQPFGWLCCVVYWSILLLDIQKMPDSLWMTFDHDRILLKKNSQIINLLRSGIRHPLLSH